VITHKELFVAGKCEQPALARNGSGENWGSKIGVILAVAGSAVGLGNFLRFPGLAAMNGGGVFMIPYFISMLLLGIPICWVEWTMGRYGGAHGYNSAPGIFSVLWRKSYGKYFGVLALLIPVVIYMYYVYVEAWCLSYAIDYATGKMAAVTDNATPDEEIQQYKDHFVNFVGKDQNGFPKGRVLIILAIVFFTNFFLIFRGLTKGIEIFCKFAMPLLIIFALIILVRVLTLGTPDPKQPENNINNALGFMWNPKVVAKYSWEQVSGPEVELSNTKAENPSFEAPVVTTPTNFKFQVKVSGGLKTEQTECEVALLPTSTKPQVNKGIIASPGEKIILGIDRSISTDIESQPFWTALADPQLWLVAAEKRRRGLVGPDRQCHQPILRSLSGRFDNRTRGLFVPRGKRTKHRNTGNLHGPRFPCPARSLQSNASRPIFRDPLVCHVVYGRHHQLPEHAPTGHCLFRRRIRPGAQGLGGMLGLHRGHR
jgi:hypothetical protein